MFKRVLAEKRFREILNSFTYLYDRFMSIHFKELNDLHELDLSNGESIKVKIDDKFVGILSGFKELDRFDSYKSDYRFIGNLLKNYEYRNSIIKTIKKNKWNFSDFVKEAPKFDDRYLKDYVSKNLRVPNFNNTCFVYEDNNDYVVGVKEINEDVSLYRLTYTERPEGFKNIEPSIADIYPYNPTYSIYGSKYVKSIPKKEVDKELPELLNDKKVITIVPKEDKNEKIMELVNFKNKYIYSKKYKKN